MAKLYFAFGSNLNLRQMGQRCPNAKPLQRVALPGWRLTFRGVADIVPDRIDWVPGGLFQISHKCEKALDRYEGYPNLYGKQYAQTKLGRVMFYTMNGGTISPPNDWYAGAIREGYKDFDLPIEYLEEAIEESRENFTSRAVFQYLRRLTRVEPNPTLSQVADAFRVKAIDVKPIIARSDLYTIKKSRIYRKEQTKWTFPT